MALTPAQIKLLKRRSADDSLEVENLLKVASCGSAADAALLRQLKADHRWSNSGKSGGSLVVPFGRWADTICCFLEEGHDGLVRLAHRDRKFTEFCMAVLEEVKAPAGVEAVLAIGKGVQANPALTRKVVYALNMLVGGADAVAVDAALAERAREMLHPLLKAARTEFDRASVVGALAHAGDAETLAILETLPPFRQKFGGQRWALKQINARLRGRKRG
jgi:hypothetical protein